MRRALKEPEAEAAYRRRQQMIEPVFAQMKLRPASREVLTPRLIRLPRRVASDGRHPQPAEALFGRFEAPGGLIGSFGVSILDHSPLLLRFAGAAVGFRNRLHGKQ